MVNAQEYLDKNYPKEVRGKLTELLISNKNLEGDLDLSDFVNLKELDCSRNKLNSLKVNNCLELKNIGCHYNQLTDLDVSNSSQLVRADCGYNLLSNITLPNNTTNLKELDLHNNKFPSTQSLSFLFPYTNLVFLYIGNDGEYGVCLKCQKPNTSSNWCQPCAEKEWQKDIKNLTGQEVIEKFIRQQQLRGNIEELFKNGQYIFFKSKQQDKKLKWIPYEEFADIEYLAEGGFGKIYKARGFGKIYKAVCKREKVVLKTLNDFCAITPTFLTEVANTKLVESQETVESQAIVSCLGISQDPKTKNYIMVMDYMSEGNLRQYLKCQTSGLNFEDRFKKLWDIISGLKFIHQQNLVHRDFHSGNILNIDGESRISDLGLSRTATSQYEKGQTFGVLPYVAPEVLQGRPYTKASDVYSFGMIAYELLANSYPYSDANLNDTSLALEICWGLRPNIDKLKIPQTLKNLIKRCWEADPEKRPTTKELETIIKSWWGEIRDKKNTHFHQQYQLLEAEYNQAIQNNPYQIDSNAVTTSKMINTKLITKQLKKLKFDKEYRTKALDELTLENLNLDELVIDEDPQKQSSHQAQIQIPPK